MAEQIHTAEAQKDAVKDAKHDPIKALIEQGKKPAI